MCGLRTDTFAVARASLSLLTQKARQRMRLLVVIKRLNRICRDLSAILWLAESPAAILQLCDSSELVSE